MILRGERCPHCNATVMRERDFPHSHLTVSCLHGHLLRYESQDGERTPVASAERGLLSTREWATNMIGPEFAERILALAEGAYGAYEEEETYEDPTLPSGSGMPSPGRIDRQPL